MKQILSLAAGFVDDRVNDIGYNVISAGITVEGLDLGATYSTKDAATDLEGMEYTASKSFDDTTLAVGYGDKEGTATYMTYGVSHSVTDSLLTYAEYQQTDNDTGTDTDQMAMGLNSFNLKQGGSTCVFIIFRLITIMIVINLEPTLGGHFFLRTLLWRYGYSKLLLKLE